MSTKEEAEGQDGLPQGSWALSRLPSTDLVLVSYCCPRAWFVQKPREAATISRWVLQGKGSEWGDLLFSCEQNLLAEFFLKEGPRSVCVMLVVISQGWLQASSHSGALSDGYLGWQFSTRGRTAPPSGLLAMSRDMFNCHSWERVLWPVVGRGQRCCQTFYNAHGSPHNELSKAKCPQWV